MNAERSETPSAQSDGDQGPGDEENSMRAGPGPGTIAVAQQRLQAEAESNRPRNRSPTPPKALFRSTTGKGVAFTDEDVTFLVRFMQYRKSQGNLDMVVFWKDVAAKVRYTWRLTCWFIRTDRMCFRRRLIIRALHGWNSGDDTNMNLNLLRVMIPFPCHQTRRCGIVVLMMCYWLNTFATNRMELRIRSFRRLLGWWV